MRSIYVIRNKVNNRLYVGQTKKSVTERFKEHLQAREISMPICHAIKKYGKENFEVKEIFKCEDKYINAAEEFFITEYNTFKGRGYNATAGGGGVRNIDVDDAEIINLYKSGLSTRAVADSLGIDHNTVATRLKKYGIDKHTKTPYRVINRKYEGRKIIAIDPNTNETVGEFERLKFAVEWAKQKRPDKKESTIKAGIKNCCGGHSKQITAAGYKWQYA